MDANSEVTRTRVCGDVQTDEMSYCTGKPDVREFGSLASAAHAHGPAAAAMAMAAASCSQYPAVNNMVVSKSSRVHVGPKFISVTQIVSNNEGRKGAGGGGVAGRARARCRGGVAVCVCWACVVACVVACAVGALALHLLLPRQHRLDLEPEVSLGRYLAGAVRRASRAERLGCAAAAAVLLLSAALVGYFTLGYAQSPDLLPDVAPHEWSITRNMWLARPYNLSSPTPAAYSPLRLVIINHSVSKECYRFIACAAELRNLQGYCIDKCDYDIPYNFIIGNDGRVYEGRGWGVVGAHTPPYNICSLGIGFIGDYREEGMKTQVSELQINRTFTLLAQGVALGRLAARWAVVGARDLRASASPGDTLYRAMQRWERYAGQAYRTLTCDQIYSQD